MPRQKLPEPYRYVEGKAWVECGADYPELQYNPHSHELEIDEGTECCSADAQAVLAVIRNAGADAVYEAAKRLVTEGPKGFGANFTALRELIEASEEP